jgi:alpha-beta hydrolase superfamily lysophospholipase
MPMKKFLIRIGVALIAVVALGLVVFIGTRSYQALQGPPLEPWHTYVPEELTPDEIDASDWAGYLKAEDRVFADVNREVVQKLPARDQVPENRYFSNSVVYPPSLTHDWNHSYELLPDGEPLGAVVLLHGLTDSPYSLRHVAQHYRDRGFVAVAVRLPAHGTVPGALTSVTWPEWMAATRLAVREAVRAVGPDKPLHVVGFSNGGALALKYALDALEDASLHKPDRLVLISPMVGITAFARFAGWPAFFPAFVNAAWLNIVPEFNPFKYNSFPVNGAVQSYQLTQALQRQLNDHTRAGSLSGLPPILTFQSIVDFTVSTRAVVRSLYAQLPPGEHELVLFDINRMARFGPLLSAASDTAVVRLLPPPPRNFHTTVIANASAGSSEVAEFRMDSGSEAQKVRDLGLTYPADNFSLSHVALPFPPDDPLYGSQPTETERYGVNLGALAPRGEVGVLIVALDSLLRVSSNPFFPYMMERIDGVIDEAVNRSALPAPR